MIGSNGFCGMMRIASFLEATLDCLFFECVEGYKGLGLHLEPGTLKIHHNIMTFDSSFLFL